MARMPPGVWVALGAVVSVAVWQIGWPPPSDARAVAVVEDWIAAMGGAEDDLGWRYISADDREREWSNTSAPYAKLVRSVDWAGLDWTVERVWRQPDMDGYWLVTTVVAGDTSSLPPALFARGLLNPNCFADNHRHGFVVVVDFTDPWRPTVGAGGQTGRMELGLCAYSLPPPWEQFVPAEQPARTGHALQVWNWTELPLYILDDRGRRVELASCSRNLLDGITSSFEVRAEDGYVATVHWWPDEGEWTWFVAIGPRDRYVAPLPPIDPIPACRGIPLVHTDF